MHQPLLLKTGLKEQDPNWATKQQITNTQEIIQVHPMKHHQEKEKSKTFLVTDVPSSTIIAVMPLYLKRSNELQNGNFPVNAYRKSTTVGFKYTAGKYINIRYLS